MLKNKDEKEIKFTPEHKAELEVYETKLANLLSEIVNHTKILKGTKSECDRAVKERAYQEELLTKIHGEIPLLEKEKASLEASIVTMKEYVEEAKIESARIKEEQDKKQSELAEREVSIKEQEVRLIENQNIFNAERLDLDAKKEKLDKFTKSLSEVIKTW